jgi:hypothetical protein
LSGLEVNEQHRNTRKVPATSRDEVGRAKLARPHAIPLERLGAGVIVAVEAVSLRRSVPLAIVTVLTSMAWSGTAGAYRPFDQTDAGVAETHDIELELGPVDYQHEPSGGTYIPGFILNYGVVERVELVFDAHHVFLFGGPDPAAGRRQLDTELLGKVVVRQGVLQDRPGPSVAIEAGAILPTVPVAGGVGAALTVVASERWPALALHLNAEADYTRAGTFAFIGGAILEGPNAWKVRPVGEFFFSHDDGAPVMLSGLGGAIWRATPHLAFDAAGRLARQDDGRVIEIRAGLTWSFEI